jgi:hypothetical protein
LILSLDEVRRAHVFVARRFGLREQLDERRIVEALEEATRLAGGRPEDEPAAALFALNRRARALGGAWLSLPLLLAENVARRHGLLLRLDPQDVELENLRLRSATPAGSFDEVRAWIAAHMTSR